MTRLHARVVGALSLCMLLGGCAFVQRQAFGEPQVTVSDVALGGGLQTGRLDVDLSVYNPNNYRLDASRIRYQATVDSMVIAEGTIDRRVTLRPRDSTTIRIPVTYEYNKLPGLFVRFAQTGSLLFRIAGDLRIETALGSVTRAFDQRGSYDGVRVSILPRSR
jgi:LEA14-like dessication related protein